MIYLIAHSTGLLKQNGLKMYRYLLLICLFNISCMDTSQPGNKSSNEKSFKPPTPPPEPSPVSKIVSISVGRESACGIDDKNRVICWKHPARYNSSSRSYAIDYPAKNNSDLIGQQFTALSATEKTVCALKNDGKVLCFSPTDSSEKKISDLSSMGLFNEVVMTENGYFCALDQSSRLSCHLIKSDSHGIDDIKSPDEILSFSLGGLISSSSGTVKAYTQGICWINSAHVLACSEIADSSEPAPVKQEGLSLTRSATFVAQKLAVILPDKKTIKIFGRKRQITKQNVSAFNFDKIYLDLAVGISDVCTIAPSTHEVSCQDVSAIQQIPEKTMLDLANERLKKVSHGFAFLCGLRTDETIFCWQEKDSPQGIPKDIKAEP